MTSSLVLSLGLVGRQVWPCRSSRLRALSLLLASWARPALLWTGVPRRRRSSLRVLGSTGQARSGRARALDWPLRRWPLACPRQGPSATSGRLPSAGIAASSRRFPQLARGSARGGLGRVPSGAFCAGARPPAGVLGLAAGAAGPVHAPVGVALTGGGCEEAEADYLRRQLGEQALRRVADSGWVDGVLEDLTLADGTPAPPTLVQHLFPRGPGSLALYFVVSRNRELGEKARTPEVRTLLASIRIPARIEYLVWERLLLIVPVGPRQWPTAMSLLAHPAMVSQAIQQLQVMVDDIWEVAGDASDDISWYTKRFVLSGVYAAAELRITQDQSPDYSATREFLSRRIADIGTVGRWRRQAESLLHHTQHTAQMILQSAGSWFPGLAALGLAPRGVATPSTPLSPPPLRPLIDPLEDVESLARPTTLPPPVGDDATATSAEAPSPSAGSAASSQVTQGSSTPPSSSTGRSSADPASAHIMPW